LLFFHDLLQPIISDIFRQMMQERKPDMKYNHYIEQILKWGALYATHFCNNTAYWEAE